MAWVDDERRVAVFGLGFGDEGKGSVVDAIARRTGARRVVRYNGGPQAAHHVVTPSGDVHCFAQFGAATLATGAVTHLSGACAVDPLSLSREASHLERLGVTSPLSLVRVERRCVVVTPFHRMLGRALEMARGGARHGSCGLGVGQALLDAARPGQPTLRVGDLDDVAAARRKLRLLALVKLDVAEQLAREHPSVPALGALVAELSAPSLVDRLVDELCAVLARVGGVDDGESLRRALRDPDERVIFEGAQGVLLDQDRGFFPYVTPSTPGPSGALLLHGEAGASHELATLGVTRAYHTRHGAGPLPGEDEGLGEALPERHNEHNPWQGPMRRSLLDRVLLRRGLSIAGRVDALAVTWLDAVGAFRSARHVAAYRDEHGRPFEPFGREPASREELTGLTECVSRCTVETALIEGASGGQGERASADALCAWLSSSDGAGVPVRVLSSGEGPGAKAFV